ncbi:MAG: molybdopterin-dependent oxidoreductase [Thermoanaerobaculia bacterium]
MSVGRSGRGLLLPFLEEGSAWRAEVGAAPLPSAEPRIGSGLGGRQIFDFATLDRRHLRVPSARFFIRTFRPETLPDARTWSLAIDGLATRPLRLPLAEFRRRSRPAGTHLLECSGNDREHDFGLISSAAWEGVPALELLERTRPTREAAAIEISGFDEHRMPSFGSVEGASWVFTREQLATTGAFFATGMNGGPLTRDHGFPLRLIVPGWYGCASIKWALRARWVTADFAATSQMKEFAARTMQDGIPEKALDFRAPAIDPAAMPVRAELFRDAGGDEVRLDGVLWGGPEKVQQVEIRCGADSPWEAVNELSRPEAGTPWRIWTHRFRPGAGGRYAVRLRIVDRGVQTRRLDQGYYERTVEIPLR